MGSLFVTYFGAISCYTVIAGQNFQEVSMKGLSILYKKKEFRVIVSCFFFSLILRFIIHLELLFHELVCYMYMRLHTMFHHVLLKDIYC